MFGNQAEDFDEQVALDEIDLYGDLVIAAESKDGPLTTAEIDAVLRVAPRRTESV